MRSLSPDSYLFSLKRHNNSDPKLKRGKLIRNRSFSDRLEVKNPTLLLQLRRFYDPAGQYDAYYGHNPPEVHPDDFGEAVKLYSDSNLLRREVLRFDSSIREVLDELWTMFDVSGDGELDEEEYITMSIRLQKMLLRNDFDIETAEAVAEEEWLVDSQGFGSLNKDRFVLSYFQMADAWTDGISATEYHGFLAEVLRKMKVMNQEQDMVKEHRQVVRRRERARERQRMAAEELAAATELERRRREQTKLRVARDREERRRLREQTNIARSLKEERVKELEERRAQRKARDRLEAERQMRSREALKDKRKEERMRVAAERRRREQVEEERRNALIASVQRSRPVGGAGGGAKRPGSSVSGGEASRTSVHRSAVRPGALVESQHARAEAQVAEADGASVVSGGSVSPSPSASGASRRRPRRSPPSFALPTRPQAEGPLMASARGLGGGLSAMRGPVRRRRRLSSGLSEEEELEHERIRTLAPHVKLAVDRFAHPEEANNPHLLFEWLLGGGDGDAQSRQEDGGRQQKPRALRLLAARLFARGYTTPLELVRAAISKQRLVALGLTGDEADEVQQCVRRLQDAAGSLLPPPRKRTVPRSPRNNLGLSSAQPYQLINRLCICGTPTFDTSVVSVRPRPAMVARQPTSTVAPRPRYHRVLLELPRTLTPRVGGDGDGAGAVEAHDSTAQATTGALRGEGEQEQPVATWGGSRGGARGRFDASSRRGSGRGKHAVVRGGQLWDDQMVAPTRGPTPRPPPPPQHAVAQWLRDTAEMDARQRQQEGQGGVEVVVRRRGPVVPSTVSPAHCPLHSRLRAFWAPQRSLREAEAAAAAALDAELSKRPAAPVILPVSAAPRAVAVGETALRQLQQRAAHVHPSATQSVSTARPNSHLKSSDNRSPAAHLRDRSSSLRSPSLPRPAAASPRPRHWHFRSYLGPGATSGAGSSPSRLPRVGNTSVVQARSSSASAEVPPQRRPVSVPQVVTGYSVAPVPDSIPLAEVDAAPLGAAPPPFMPMMVCPPHHHHQALLVQQGNVMPFLVPSSQGLSPSALVTATTPPPQPMYWTPHQHDSGTYLPLNNEVEVGTFSRGGDDALIGNQLQQWWSSRVDGRRVAGGGGGGQYGGGRTGRARRAAGGGDTLQGLQYLAVVVEESSSTPQQQQQLHVVQSEMMCAMFLSSADTATTARRSRNYR